MQFSSIWPIDRTLSGATTPVNLTMKGYSAFPKPPASLEPYHLIVLYHIQDTYWEGSLTYKGTVGVFYSPSQQGSSIFYPTPVYECRKWWWLLLKRNSCLKLHKWVSTMTIQLAQVYLPLMISLVNWWYLQLRRHRDWFFKSLFLIVSFIRTIELDLSKMEIKKKKTERNSKKK